MGEDSRRAVSYADNERGTITYWKAAPTDCHNLLKLANLTSAYLVFLSGTSALQTDADNKNDEQGTTNEK